MDTCEDATDPGRRAGAVPAIAAAGLLACLAAACDDAAAVHGRDQQPVAEAFLGLIRAGKVDDAWASTSAEFKSMLGQDGLRAYVRTYPALRSPATLLDSDMTERNGLRLLEYRYRAEVTTKAKGKAKSVSSTATIKVLLAKEGDAWKVERLSVE